MRAVAAVGVQARIGERIESAAKDAGNAGDAQALARECAEELGVRVEVGARVGPDVPLAHGRAVLRVFAVSLLDGDVPRALEHTSMRWLTVDELGSVPWLPADEPIVAELPALLATDRPA